MIEKRKNTPISIHIESLYNLEGFQRVIGLNVRICFENQIVEILCKHLLLQHKHNINKAALCQTVSFIIFSVSLYSFFAGVSFFFSQFCVARSSLMHSVMLSYSLWKCFAHLRYVWISRAQTFSVVVFFSKDSLANIFNFCQHSMSCMWSTKKKPNSLLNDVCIKLFAQFYCDLIIKHDGTHTRWKEQNHGTALNDACLAASTWYLLIVHIRWISYTVSIWYANKCILSVFGYFVSKIG